MAKRADLKGKTFNYLKVICYHQTLRNRHDIKNAIWKCKCKCGNITLVSSTNIQRGKIKSCGCLQKESVGKINRTHGRSRTPEYRIWTRIKSRCYNPNTTDYKYYGGRGIKMCDKWVHSFEKFFLDMGKRPSLLHTIDRIENNVNYTPKNCRWATRETQTRNRTNTKTLTYKGQTKPMAEWAEIIGMPYTTIQSRVARGWPVFKIIETPVLKTWNRRP